jgi:hypothetical protein
MYPPCYSVFLDPARRIPELDPLDAASGMFPPPGAMCKGIARKKKRWNTAWIRSSK